MVSEATRKRASDPKDNDRHVFQEWVRRDEVTPATFVEKCRAVDQQGREWLAGSSDGQNYVLMLADRSWWCVFSGHFQGNHRADTFWPAYWSPENTPRNLIPGFDLVVAKKIEDSF